MAREYFAVEAPRDASPEELKRAFEELNQILLVMARNMPTGGTADEITATSIEISITQAAAAAALQHTQNSDTILDEGETNEVTAADIRTLLDASPNCKIKLGSYEGNDTTSQAITGVGFQVLAVFIAPRPAGADGATHIYMRWDGATANWGDMCLHLSTEAGAEVFERDDKVIALGSDGFTVDDAGGNGHPNKSGTTYDYLTFG